MAILQLSRITNRKGLSEDLPQLAGAEFGWSLDDRKLFIGNGTIVDGAPVIGNTEILTEYSDILALGSVYTYKGLAAGYQVDTSGETSPILRSLTSKFDDFASVKDFGAVGDGIIDDTAAINRALFELFCKAGTPPRARRSLYFPAGTYKVTNTIKIPPHAKMYGEGIQSSIIKYEYLASEGTVTHVVATTDNGHIIGGSTEGIEVYSMSFSTTQSDEPGSVTEDDVSILSVDAATTVSFDHVELRGYGINITDVQAARPVTTTLDILGASSDISFTNMITSGTTYSLRALATATKGVVFENSKLDLHRFGAQIGGVSDGPTGVVISRNIFNRIAFEGIAIGNCAFNGSAYNIFYEVGNNFSVSPLSPVISMLHKDNISVGDQFERDDTDNEVYPRVELPATGGIAFDGSYSLKLGSYQRIVGVEATLADNTTSGSVFTFTNTQSGSFKVDYNISRLLGGTTETRVGSLHVSNNGTVNYNEEYTDSIDVGVELEIIGSTFDSELQFTTTSIGNDATINYSIVRLD